MLVTQTPPPKPEPLFTIVLTGTELARITGILGKTFGSDGEGLYDPMSAALFAARILPIYPSFTTFDFVRSR